LVFIASGHVWACVCGAYPSVKQAWEVSPAVFVGNVEKADPNPKSLQLMIPEQTVTVRVEEPFKGSFRGQAFILIQDASDCAPKFKTGQRVLLYLYPAFVPNLWTAPGCSRPMPVEDAADDLLFLRGLPASARKNRFAGEVALYENSVSEGFRRSHVLSGIHVQLRSGSQSIDALTNNDGVYEVYGVPPGKYHVTLDLPKGLNIDFPIVAGGEGRRDRLKDLRTKEPVVDMGGNTAADVDFVLMVDNAISGRVLDPAGKPMKDVCVQLEPATGQANGYFYISNCSDSDGRFSLTDMPPGQYVISANVWVNGRAQEPKMFYPGTADRKSAVVITIGSGEHLGGFELRVTK
jgi:hypothetical protein